MHSKKIKKTWDKKCNKALIKKCEKYNWEFILIIRKIQVIRVVKKNLETNSNWKWMYNNGASVLEKLIKIRDNALVIKKVFIAICLYKKLIINHA